MVIEAINVTPDGWELWREMRLAALADAPLAFASTLAEWSGPADTEHRWRGRLEGVALNLVLTCDDEPVGMVSATAPDDVHPAELISMWVAPTGRGRGAGDEAIRQVVAWVRENFPTSDIELSVKTNNRHAIRLYARHGFVDAGPSPYGSDERLMRF
jgi:RimJ/RimL family protein N-acetyltransferase